MVWSFQKLRQKINFIVKHILCKKMLITPMSHNGIIYIPIKSDPNIWMQYIDSKTCASNRIWISEGILYGKFD